MCSLNSVFSFFFSFLYFLVLLPYVPSNPPPPPFFFVLSLTRAPSHPSSLRYQYTCLPCSFLIKFFGFGTFTLFLSKLSFPFFFRLFLSNLISRFFFSIHTFIIMSLLFQSTLQLYLTPHVLSPLLVSFFLVFYLSISIT